MGRSKECQPQVDSLGIVRTRNGPTGEGMGKGISCYIFAVSGVPLGIGLRISSHLFVVSEIQLGLQLGLEIASPSFAVSQAPFELG